MSEYTPFITCFFGAETQLELQFEFRGTESHADRHKKAIAEHLRAIVGEDYYEVIKLAGGGCKQVITFGDTAVFLPNNGNEISEEMWLRIISEEKAAADEIRAHGLLTQDLAIEQLSIINPETKTKHTIEVLTAPRFDVVARSKQATILDGKNSDSLTGTRTSFFDHNADILKPEKQTEFRAKVLSIFQSLANDIYLALTNNIPIHGDSANLIVLHNTDAKHPTVRVFPYDFTSKSSKLELPIYNGAPNPTTLESFKKEFLSKIAQSATGMDDLDRVALGFKPLSEIQFFDCCGSAMKEAIAAIPGLIPELFAAAEAAYQANQANQAETDPLVVNVTSFTPGLAAAASGSTAEPAANETCANVLSKSPKTKRFG